MSAEGAPAPWYGDGLRFHCTACGACCTGAPGHVWVSPEEIERMARAKGLSVRRYRKRYVRRVGERLSLRERENGDCVMLEDRRCSVYEAKPGRCSTFPFWPEVLADREAWRETAERCEGIDQGPVYPTSEIERLLAGDPAPLAARQALAAEEGGARPPEAPEAPDWEGALGDLEALYADLEAELPRWRFTCAASGRCCDFDAYGHRLYATTLEIEHFLRHAPAGRANEDERQCPAYGEDGLCHAREGRMLGCRTYFCGPYPVGVPEDLHETWYARIKEIHRRRRIPFAYRDVVDWARERRPARGTSAGLPRP